MAKLKKRRQIDEKAGASLATLREILSQRGSKPVKRPVNLVAGDYKRWGDADHVFVGALARMPLL
jgi:hypothetical protein